MSKQKCIKVNYLGDTKRIKMTNSYESLALQTRETFGQGLESVWPIKFYYLDDEQELISITSQSDFLEALSIEDFSMLKLTVAANVQEARKQLEQQLNASMSLAESLNQSQSQMPRMSLMSNASAIRFVEDQMPDTERREYKKISHEMGVGSSDIKMVSQDAFTDVKNLVTKDEIGVMTKNIVMTDMNIATCTEFAVASSQIGAETRDMGCDGVPSATFVHGGNQMETIQLNTQEVECNILIPCENSSDEEFMEEQINCFKCKGTQINKKGLPCRKCNGSGVFSLKGFGPVIKVVREEIETFCTDSFRTLYSEYLAKKRADQKSQVHAGYTCDGCSTTPITGVRYMCSVCTNYDICEKCESKGIHIEHPMLKIRKVSQAPAKLICQYTNMSSSAKVSEQSSTKLSSINTLLSKDQNESVTSFVSQSSKGQKGKPRYEGRFVKESIGDKHKVMPGEYFTKQWTYRNGGEVAWPADVVFIQSSGDNMNAEQVPISGVVMPGNDYVWEVMLKAPERPGRYTAYFRMQTGHKVRFGHKVWCDILVEVPVENTIEQPVSQQPTVIEVPVLTIVEQPVVCMPEIAVAPIEQVKMSISEAFMKEDELANSFEIEDTAIVELGTSLAELPLDEKANQILAGDKQVNELECNPFIEIPVEELKEMNVSQMMPITPKTIYFNQVDKEPIQQLRTDLTILYDFGFVNFEVNYKMLLTHKSVETAAAHLLESSGLNQ